MLFASIKVPLEDSTAKAQARAIDIKDQSKMDLESLRHEDPFMYYSIPGILTATIFGKDVDPSNKQALCRRNHISAQSETLPNASTKSSSSSSSDSIESNTVVLRKTRISFEAPMDLEDLMINDDTNEDDEFDVLDALIMQMHMKNVRQ